MPIRPRRRRRPRHELTLQRDLLLSLGPDPGTRPPQPDSDEWETLRACWEANQAGPPELRYGPKSWGHVAFVDDDLEAALNFNRLIPVNE